MSSYKIFGNDSGILSVKAKLTLVLAKIASRARVTKVFRLEFKDFRRNLQKFRVTYGCGCGAVMRCGTVEG